MKEPEQMSEMQRELLNRADVIFAKVSEAASKAADFASEQLPDIAYQFIAYNRAYITAVVVIGIILFSMSIWLFNGAIKNKWNDIDRSIFAGFGGVITFVIGFTLSVNNFKSFMMVWFAPKIFLITEIAQLVKAMK